VESSGISLAPAPTALRIESQRVALVDARPAIAKVQKEIWAVVQQRLLSREAATGNRQLPTDN